MRRLVKGTTALLMAAVGFAFSANALTAQGTDLRSQRVADLKSLVLARANDVAVSEASTKRLRDEVESLAVEFTSPELRRVRSKIAALKATNALTGLEGPAVTVTLDDAPADPSLEGDDFDSNWLLIHQQDIEAVVNALWQGGADGITVMGQRITSTSAVRCVGSTVLVNGKVFSPPFVIVAVGDPTKLHKALNEDVSVDYLKSLARAFGLTYLVEDNYSVYLPAYTGTLALQYAGSLD